MQIRRLDSLEISAALALKILLGILYGYIYLRFYGGDDTWKHFEVSLKETELLISDPLRFFIQEYTPVHSIRIADSLTEAISLYLFDLQYAMLVKTMAILNLIVGHHYYIHTALFNLLFFFGHYHLFYLMYKRFPGHRQVLLGTIFFFVPAVFWLSGMRVDGLLFFFTATFLRLFTTGTFTFLRVSLMALMFIGMLACRMEVGLLLLPGLLAWWLSNKRVPVRPFNLYVLTYLISGLFFFLTALLPDGGLPQRVADRQRAFFQLTGTRLPLHELNSHPFSFAETLPQALANTLVHPLPWETDTTLQLLASGEILLFWLMLGFFLTGKDQGGFRRISRPLPLLLIFGGSMIIISIGLVVPFPGAIIRYRAMAELLILTGMAVCYRSSGEYRKAG